MGKNWNSVLSRVKALLMRCGSSHHDAEDFVQDAFVKYTSYPKKESIVEPEAFITRVAQNLRRDAYRASKRQGEQVLDAEKTLVDPSPSLDDALLAREQVEIISKVLATLDPKTCRIFLAHRVYGMSYADIARECEISVSAVEKQIAKAALIITRAVEGW